MRNYQYCGKEECIERQGLGQVSELEATLETCRLSQLNRVLDPRLAVSKYRRSAAGDCGRPLRSREQLQTTLSHLIQICACLRSSPDHPPSSLEIITSFVVDRLRACQSDATRLLSNPDACVPSSWHAKVIRILIWLRYASGETNHNDADAQNTARMIDHMRSTAYDAYWNTVDPQPGFVGIDDDEMLCYHAISRICAVTIHSTTNYETTLETSWNSITLEFQKRRRPETAYPLWNLALGIASHVRREEYYVLWKPNHPLTRELPVLAKSILSGEVFLQGRYRTVEHYNKSFGKGESVSDMHRLLGIDQANGWSIEYASVFGVPVEETKNNDAVSTKPTITMKLKEVAMAEFDSSRVDAITRCRIRQSDRRWIFGEDFDDSSTSPLGISPKLICGLLEFGCGPSIHIDTMSQLLGSDDNNVVVEIPTSSLSRALARSDVTDGVSCSFSASDSSPPLRTRASPLQAAIDRIKKDEAGKSKHEEPKTARKKANGKKKHSKKPKPPCRFFYTSAGCKFGDKCRFDHTL